MEIQIKIYIGRITNNYLQTSDISCTLEGYEIFDHSDTVGASSFLTLHLASMDWTKTATWGDQKYLSFWAWCAFY